MSWNPAKVETISPLSPQSRRPSQIPRKPVGRNLVPFEVAHSTNHHESRLADSEGVSPISERSSGLRSPADRVASSYFSPESIRFSKSVSNAWGTRPLPFVDLDANEAEFRTEEVTDYSNRASSVRRRSEAPAHRDTYTSVYSEHGLGSNAFPSFGMSVDEAAYLENSTVTSAVGSLHRAVEQSIVEARLGQFHRGQIVREATVEQRTDQAMFEPPGMDFNNPKVAVKPDSLPKWLPMSLRWWFLVLLFFFTLGLSLAALLLTIHSHNNQGLGTERDTSAFLFTRKFVPILFAVIYATLVMDIITDIRRTELYARLSRPAGAPASTLFLRPGPLWLDPFTALRATTNGGVRNWALFWAALINILSFLLIVPFSAAFIYPAEIVFINPTTYSRLAESPKGPLKLSMDDSVLFQTISSELLNTTTSVWVSNEYAVLPFWPSDQQTMDLGSFPSSPSQQWTANTTVYQADFECSLMSLQSFANFTLPATGTNLLSFVIRANDGCSLGLAGLSPDSGSNTIFSTGGGWWAEAPNFDYPLFWPPVKGTVGDFEDSHSVILNTTSQCGTRSMFFVAEPYVYNKPFKARGQVCTSSYFSASLPVTVSNTEPSPSITFDTKLFESAKEPLAPSVLDIPTLERSFLDQDWANKLQSPSSRLNTHSSLKPKFGGPLSLLGAKNGFNLPEILASTDLTTQARQIKQRFLGESMMSSFHRMGAQKSEPINGTIASIERRIFVSIAAGIILTTTLIVLACMLLLVAFHTRLHQRPLSLLRDPSSLKAMASLISSRLEIQSLFEGTDRASDYVLRHKLSGYVLYLKNGELHAYGMDDVSQLSTGVYSDAGSLEANNWCPKMLRPTTIRLFLASLIVIVLVLGVLFGVFHKTATSHSSLGPELNKGYTDRTVAALAPYAVIPTLISLGIMLYWASMARTISSLQPYVSMARKATPTPQNPSSFGNTTRLWTIGLAARNREFFLSVVVACAVLSQVLTVTISGLWERNPAFEENSVSVRRSAELRTVPAIFTVAVPPILDAEKTNSKAVLSNVFDSSLNSWMFSSVNEGAYNSTPPPWTSQDWVFAPFDLTSVLTTLHTGTGKGVSTLNSATDNITVQAPSLRGRLECIPIDMSDTSAWLKTLDLTDKATWNNQNMEGDLAVGYEIDLGYPFNFSTAGYQMPTSGIKKNSTEESAIGSWTHSADDPHAGIVVQWIVGYPVPYQTRSPIPQNQQTRWIWKDIPKVTALKCLPVFESANATVNVDLATGAVKSYAITNAPSSDPNAWSSRYQALNVSTGVPYSSIPGVGAGFQSSPGTFLQNITVSYGYLFHDIILGAADAARIDETPSSIAENMVDRTFKFQLPHLSADFMSYTSLALSGNNKSALLDATALGNISSTVFSIFFKNFAKAQVSPNDALYINGSWGLQPLAATVPSDLGPILGSNPIVRLQSSLQRSRTNPTAEGVLRAQVENLDMNHTVAIICLCILSIFITTIVVIMVYSKRYLRDLPRNMDTVGSVLALLYGSERLLELAQDSENKTNEPAQREMLKMGWFEAGQKKRWGIEVVQPGDRFSKEFLGVDKGFKEVRLSN